MAAPAFLSAPGSQSPISMHATSQSALSSSSLHMKGASPDRHSRPSRGFSLASTPMGGVTVALIRRLPLQTSEESLRLMMVFSKDLIHVELLCPAEQSNDPGFLSAILRFRTAKAAVEVKVMLDGKPNISGDADMIVEILGGPPGRMRHQVDTSMASTPGASTATSSTAPSAAFLHQAMRFHGGFPHLERPSSPLSTSAMFGSSDLASPESSSHYQTIFLPQVPISNFLSDAHRVSSKSLINDDADDEETGELLKNPVAYAQNEAMSGQQRSAMGPHVPTSRMAGLSLNVVPPNGSASMQYNQTVMGPMAPNRHFMSPTGHHHHYPVHNIPSMTWAVQNPPCDTLFVGNLPIDTSEEELEAIFSMQEGYKCLNFVPKQGGHICFAKFENALLAKKALLGLSGVHLRNSVKGAIRLNFSKNPLVVRSDQATSQDAGRLEFNSRVAGSGSPCTMVGGLPSRLPAPPGIRGGGSSIQHNSLGFARPAGNAWNSYTYGSSILAAAAVNYPPQMMGR